MHIIDDVAGTPTNKKITLANVVAFLDTQAAYGEIAVYESATPVTLNSAAKVQVTDFDTNGPSQRMTPDHTNDHITVDYAGDYLCTTSIAFQNSAGQPHVVDITLYKNNGDTAFENLHGTRTLGAGSEVGSMSISGIVTLAATDTIEMWATTSVAGNRDVTFQDVTMSLVKIA